MATNFAAKRRGAPVTTKNEMLVLNIQTHEQPDVVVSHIEPDGTVFVQVCYLPLFPDEQLSVRLLVTLDFKLSLESQMFYSFFM